MIDKTYTASNGKSVKVVALFSSSGKAAFPGEVYKFCHPISGRIKFVTSKGAIAPNTAVVIYSDDEDEWFMQSVDSFNAAFREDATTAANNEPCKVPSQTELLIMWVLDSAPHPGVYGLDIQRAFEECSNGGEPISLGTLYSMLKRLRRKGYIDSVGGDSLSGGAKRQYYFLTEAGMGAARNANEFCRQLQQWQPCTKSINHPTPSATLEQ